MDLNPMDLTLDVSRTHAMAFICSSDAWIETFEPLLRGMERSAIESLLDPSDARKAEKSDEFLRNQVIIIRAFLNFPEYLLEEYRREEEAAKEAQTVQQQYEERVADGRYGQFGGAIPDDNNAL